MPDILQVITTVDSAERANEIARTLVDERLAGCVQVDGPIDSFYRWEGKVQSDREWRCTIKTTSTCLAQIERRFETLHPYDVPELLCTRVDSCGAAYAAWLQQQTTPR